MKLFSQPAARRRLSAFSLSAVVAVAALLACAGCAHTARQADAPLAPAARAYRVYWTANNAKDNAPLLSVSSVAVTGRVSAARTDSTAPAENRPALPLVIAAVSPTRRPGVLELNALVKVREVNRTKKGKLKVAKRNIRALIPIRSGETQQISSAGDAIRLEVRLEPAESGR